MENRRFILMCLLGVVLFFMWQAWERDFAPGRVTAMTPPATVPEGRPASADGVPAASAPAADVPAVGAGDPTAATAGTGAPDSVPTAAPAAPVAAPVDAGFDPASPAPSVRVTTDRFVATISLEGGDLRRLELVGYPLHKDHPDRSVPLLDDGDPHWFVLQSGVAGEGGALVSHFDRFASEQSEYALPDGADELVVTLVAQATPGLRVTKQYSFRRGSYQIGLSHTVHNDRPAAVTASPYVQLWRTPVALGDEPPFVKSFMGFGVYEQKPSGGWRFRKVDFEDAGEEPVTVRQTGGWLAMLQHYFVAAIIPPAAEPATFAAKASTQKGFLGQYLGNSSSIPPGGEQRFAVGLYLGPKLQTGLAPREGAAISRFWSLDGLEFVAPGLDLTVDYGWLTAIAGPLFWVLAKIHQLTGNWGVAIILLTILVKLAMYKLSEAQYRSMAKMRKFAPKIQDLKDRHGEDREKLQKAMMELYQKEGFNPLGGCWPILVQFPVFIALYWVLLESVELRQADFALWLTDLSSPDPFYVLPVLFGISMWAQQKLSGTTMTMDPMQQRVMNAMPIMLTAFFAFFPAGLVLYWFVSNLIGIGQQWYIYRKLDAEGLGHRVKT